MSRWLLVLGLVLQGCSAPKTKEDYLEQLDYSPAKAPATLQMTVRIEASHEISAGAIRWSAAAEVEPYRQAVAEVVVEDFKRSSLFKRVLQRDDGETEDVLLRVTTRDERPGRDWVVTGVATLVNVATGAEIGKYDAWRSLPDGDRDTVRRSVVIALKEQIVSDYRSGKFARRQQRMARAGPAQVRVEPARPVVDQQLPIPVGAPSPPTIRISPPPPAAASPNPDIAAPTTGVVNRDAIAVVIGIRDYRNKDIPTVDFALNDAEAVKQYLLKTLGYQEGNVLHLTNASKAEIEAAFGTREDPRGKLYNYVKPGKSDLFIYYSGHGAPDVERRQGYFVPSDADPQAIGITGYSLEVLYANVAHLVTEQRVPSAVIVIDACFSGASEGGSLLKNVSPLMVEVNDPAPKLRQAVVLTSSLGKEVSSWYPEKGHSMFTYLFLKALKERVERGAQVVTADEIFAALSDQTEGVPYFARRFRGRIQTPELRGDGTRPLFRR